MMERFLFNFCHLKTIQTLATSKSISVTLSFKLKNAENNVNNRNNWPFGPILISRVNPCLFQIASMNFNFCPLETTKHKLHQD